MDVEKGAGAEVRANVEGEQGIGGYADIEGTTRYLVYAMGGKWAGEGMQAETRRAPV